MLLSASTSARRRSSTTALTGRRAGWLVVLVACFGLLAEAGVVSEE